MTLGKMLAVSQVGVLAGASVCCGGGPAFWFERDIVLSGDAFAYALTGAGSGAKVVVTASRSYFGTVYQSEAVFHADGSGRIDFLLDAPESGPWSGVDPRGFFWSMTDTGEAAPSSWRWENVHFAADVDADGEPDASARITLRRGAADLVEVPLGDAHPGAFFLRAAGEEPLPVIIVLGGSEGGDRTARLVGPKLASRGFAVVGVPYYSPGYYGKERQFEGLPAAFHDIPIDRMESVLAWVRARDDVHGDRIGLYGVSKGAEFALLAASLIDEFSAVAAIVPSDVVWEGWGPGTTEGEDSSFSWRGEPVAFVPYTGMSDEIAKYSTGGVVRIRTPHDAGRAHHSDRVTSARIRVDRIDEPVFVVGGDADDVWDSGGMARSIVQARDAVGLSTVSFIDADAGHGLSGDGYSPTGAAEARVQGAAFPAMLRFFNRSLGE